MPKKNNQHHEKIKPRIKPQHQSEQPGLQTKMYPEPISIYDNYQGSHKLKNKIAIITGGDSGIGRAVAYHFAMEGADVAIVYLKEDKDAEITQEFVEKLDKKCLLFRGDVGKKSFCEKVIKKTYKEFGQIDIIINNAAEQHPTEYLEKITEKQLEKTFRTNIFSYFFMVQAALPHLKKNSIIINTTSVTAYRGSSHLVDYSATKGAIVSFTRSLSELLVKKGIRVNAVAPGPVWTPLIPASFSKKKVGEFGKKSPMGHAAQPADIAPSYVFLASQDANFISGQVLHPNGGEIINT